jgi:VanZ family protein
MKYLLLAVLTILFGLTLLGSPVEKTSYALQEFWNLGHIVLFSILVIYLLKHWQWLSQKTTTSRIIILFFIVLTVSVVIEGSQYIFSNGTPDITDIRRNLIGASLGYFITIRNAKFRFFKFGALTIILLVLFESWSFFNECIYDIKAYYLFPVICDFETNSDFRRWVGSQYLEKNDVYYKSGSFSAKVTFTTSKYSGIFYEYFPSDWSEYSKIKFSAFNPDKHELELNLRIHDKEYLNGSKAYNDRFNKKVNLKNGWNEIEISLKEVEESPANRKMNMNKILSIGLFTIKQKEVRTIYLDFLRLD